MVVYVCDTDLSLLPHSAAHEVLLGLSERSPSKLRPYTVSF